MDLLSYTRSSDFFSEQLLPLCLPSKMWRILVKSSLSFSSFGLLSICYRYLVTWKEIDSCRDNTIDGLRRRR